MDIVFVFQHKLGVKWGVNFVLLTGNPGNGVTNTAITETLSLYKKELGDKLILAAGKMHASGILSEAGEKILTKEDIKEFREAGADIPCLFWCRQKQYSPLQHWHRDGWHPLPDRNTLSQIGLPFPGR